MFLAEALSDFYPDLKDDRFISRYAIFHQRFSTNTAPSWDLAQPFRSIAHNGEINTLRGNVNSMVARQGKVASGIFDTRLNSIFPVIDDDLSDSGSFDAVLEFLLLGSIYFLNQRITESS